MKKILLYITIIFIMSGCQKELAKNDNTISEFTENIMLEKGKAIEKETIEETPIIEKEAAKNEMNIDKIDVVNQPKHEESATTQHDDIEITEEKKDEYNPDYQIHKGRIDCVTTDECIDLSLPIQFELKNIIDSVFYLEVKTNSNKSLGYFIDYHFKEYQYENYDTCVLKANYLEEKLSDRTPNYECTDDGIFKVYGSDIDD